MKKSDVPQDDDFSQNGKYKEVTYAVSEKGNSEPVLSRGWRPKNDALRYVWETINAQAKAIGKKVIQGELSPIAYYMEKNIMDLKLLAQYMGLPRKTVKRHLHPKGFEKLNHKVRRQYADLFNISFDDLTDVEKLKDEIKSYEN
jgi:hypothetical protein